MNLPENCSRSKKKGILVAFSSSTSAEDIVEEREELMVCKNPCFNSIDGYEATNLPKNRSVSSSPFSKKALTERFCFNGWRQASASFLSWAGKMSALHETTWRKAGIFEAVKASTTKIHKNADLVLGIVEKWCPETNTFVFPWGETTITLEDIMMLLGFSVLGLPVFASLESTEKKTIQNNLEKEWKIKKEQAKFVSGEAWTSRFMDSDDELEHAAFLALWLNYFVFPSCYYHISEAIFPIAVHLSSGTRIALAPAVLGHLYSELTLLKTHITDSTKSRIKIDLTALFKLVQVWIWERFKELQPKPVQILNDDQSRLDRWHEVKQRTRDAKQILENSKIDSFVWRPYSVEVGKWKFPQFYPEKDMSVPVGPNLDDEFISFARCIRVSELVGIHCVEHYFPDRVTTQFGLFQNVPERVHNRSSLSKEKAWNDYNKPIEESKLYIPSRYTIPCVTLTYSKWWSKTFLELQYPSQENQVSESAETSKSRNITKQVRRKSTLGQVPADNDEDDCNQTIAQMARLIKNKKRNSGGDDASEPLAKKRRLEADNNESGHPQKLSSLNKIRLHLKYVRDKKRRKIMKQARDKRRMYTEQLPSDNNDEDGGLDALNNDPSAVKKLASLGANGNETVSPPEIEERNQETNETGSNTVEDMVLIPFDERKALDAPLESNGGVVEIGVSPSETRQICDDAYGSDAYMVDENEYDDESLIQKNLAVEELILEAYSCEKIASEGANGDETSKGLSSYDKTNTSDHPHVGFDGAIETFVLPLETREACNDELDVHGSNDGSKEHKCLLQEDDNLCSEAVKENDVVANGRINESSRMVVSQTDESNIHVNEGITVGDGNQRQDCLLRENGLGTPKSSNVQSEISEKGKDIDSHGKNMRELKAKIALIEELINKTDINLTSVKEIIKQR